MNKTYEDKINRATQIYLKREQERKLNNNGRIDYNNIISNKNSNINEYNIKDKNKSYSKKYDTEENDDKKLNNVYNMEDYYTRCKEEKELRRKKSKARRKLIKIIWTLINIYIIALMIQYRSQIFKDNVTQKIDAILDYNINFYNKTKNYIINNNKDVRNNSEANEQLNSNANDEKSSVELENQNIIPVSNIELNNLPSKDEFNTYSEEAKKEKIVSYLKENNITPVVGTVSSEFGTRETFSQNISKNHKGIDIAANENSIIKSAMEGVVIDTKYSPSYGNYIKIENNIYDEEVINLYAHCKDIYVHINDYINRGQEIASVGSTGNSTGPHLHFEVIYNGEYINPREALNI